MKCIEHAHQTQQHCQHEWQGRVSEWRDIRLVSLINPNPREDTGRGRRCKTELMFPRDPKIPHLSPSSPPPPPRCQGHAKHNSGSRVQSRLLVGDWVEGVGGGIGEALHFIQE